MLRIGLTGGLASGKSFVAHAFGDLGCLVIRADDLGHEVLMPGAEAYDAVLREFGPEILSEETANGQPTIDRRKLGAIVFQQPERLKVLNALVHPAVRARGDALMNTYFAEHPDGIAIFEAAILVETGRYKDFDRLVLAVCGVEQQIERAMARDGLTREEVQDRLSRQMPLGDKIRYANYVIDTSKTKEETVAQVRTVYEKLRSLRPNHG
jgi:dephospho-CoA kinase